MVKRADGQGKALRQVILQKGIEWQPNPFPETFLGETTWTDSLLSTDVLVEGDGFASLFGRVSNCAQNGNPPRGVWLQVETSGQWTLRQRTAHPGFDAKGKPKQIEVETVLAQGTTSFPPNHWQRLQLSFKGDQVAVSINGTEVGTVHTDCTSGMAGIGSGWHAAQFDNITLQ